MAFADQIRYNTIFPKAVHKVGESKINYIKIFHDAKALEISVGNIYTEYHLMHTFLYNFQKGVKCSYHIAIHQADMRRE